MGLAFTIDSPVKVARYGISSAISIVEDNLVEMMRKIYYAQQREPYIPISPTEENYRARRITDYLNLINRIVKDQVQAIKASAFEAGSEIVKYFDMLPGDSPLKQDYLKMKNIKNPDERRKLEQSLRNEIQPGAIEVNIMTKIDRDHYHKNGMPVPDGSDALSALRGYACSGLQNSAVIFSAGMNPRLFNYMERFEAFDAKGWGQFDKKVIVKVSDFRSAMIQGKYLAKKGIWVSEFRIESGLNCGGHAFATEGLLIGPILEEFQKKKAVLINDLFELYKSAVQAKNKPVFDMPHPIKITVQGGIGTFEEADFLHRHYGVSGTGWGTPFLLCPEATTVDAPTLQLLCKAGEEDVVLSKNSPLGVRFHYLKGTSGEIEKYERVEKGSPGSPCTEKFLVSNTEFTKAPICTASKKYQKLKIKQLQAQGLPEAEFRKQSAAVYSKECLCVGLSNSAAIEHEHVFVKNQNAVTICPGPNIAYFSKVVSLREMTDHIYGRANIIDRSERPHMFLKELWLYLDYLSEQVAETVDPDKKFIKYCSTFAGNLKEGIAYYQRLMEGKATASGLKEGMKRSLADAEAMLALLTDRIQNRPVELQDA